MQLPYSKNIFYGHVVYLPYSRLRLSTFSSLAKLHNECARDMEREKRDINVKIVLR